MRRTRASRIFPAIAALMLAAAARGSGAERKITVVVEAREPLKTAVLARFRSTFPDLALFSIHEFDASRLGDPIQKGRLLASLQNSDLLAAIGDAATELVLNELEDVSVYFIGGSLISGDRLTLPSVAGILSYNLDGLLDAVKSLWSGNLGLAYTPGYEKIAAVIRAGAKTRGFTVLERKISTRKEIPAAINELLEHSQVVWIMGDPLLARGAGFQFLVERALSRRVPIVAAGSWEVKQGAFLSMEPPAEALALEAADALKAAAAGRGDPESSQVQTAPPGGSLLYNGLLAEKWKIQVPAGAKWRPR